MARLVSASRAQRASGHARLARRVADALGGRYFSVPGVGVDAGDAEIERWFLAATVFGTRISAAVAECTFGVLSDAGLARIGQARHIPLDDFIALLDECGYARYAARTAARLKALPGIIGERYDGRAAMIGQQFSTYPKLRAALDALPGWGPGIYPAVPARTAGRVARRAAAARPARRARRGHLGLLGPGPAPAAFLRLAQLAAGCYTGRRDLESGLVSLALADHRPGWAYARAGTCASCPPSALSASD